MDIDFLVVFQLWVYMIIFGSVFTIEMLTIAMSSSLGHILENLSYRAGVVMTRWTCDETPITDLLHKREVQSVMSTFNITMNYDLHKKDPMNADKVVTKSVKELESDLVFTKSEMSRVVKNLVDIEYGLEGFVYLEKIKLIIWIISGIDWISLIFSYHRVESVSDAFNFSFGYIIANHVMVVCWFIKIQLRLN